jgi:exopolyphosphatase / guanosine-5'-triphosphate,3'-diphosphate pyrophosphatase
MPDYKAVIDIGTNSLHLIIAETTQNKIINIIHREKTVVRLGSEHKDVLSRISSDEIKKALKVLKEFKKLSEFYKAELFAVATSAVRESVNRDEFVNIVRDQTGINIRVLDGREEASFIFYGVQNALPVNDQKIVCIDIGGGSTEIIIGNNGNIDFVQSYKLGAVRLTKMFFPQYIITPSGIKDCTEYILKTLNESDLPDFVQAYDSAVGASGTILSVASVSAVNKYGKLPEDLNGFTFTDGELEETSDLILGKITLEERTTLNGIDKSRAEIIAPGVLILKNLFNILKIENMIVSGYALREGFLLSQLKN